MHKELHTLHGAGGHAELVQCYGVWFQEGSLCIAMEWMDAGSLADLLKAVGLLPERALAHICRSALRGLALMRELRLVHRDLKPQARRRSRICRTARLSSASTARPREPLPAPVPSHVQPRPCLHRHTARLPFATPRGVRAERAAEPARGCEGV